MGRVASFPFQNARPEDAYLQLPQGRNAAALRDRRDISRSASARTVASEIIRNLNLCITEKAAKIAPYMERFREWWLVLPDHIGPDLNADERSTIGEHVKMLRFSRVVLIHPRDPTRALILNPAKGRR